MALVEAVGLKKTYTVGDIEVQAIRGIDFVIAPESFVSFVGPSGSGKSTLLNMIGCSRSTRAEEISGSSTGMSRP